MTKLFKNEYIIREAKGGHVPPVPPPESAFACQYHVFVLIGSDSRELRKQQSAIFRWEKGRFTVYQSLYTLGAQGWEHFAIGKQVRTCL